MSGGCEEEEKEELNGKNGQFKEEEELFCTEED